MAKRWGILVSLVAVALTLVTFTGSILAAPPSPAPGPNYGFGFMGGVMLQRVASLLGITTDDIAAQLRQGKTLVQIGQTRNVSEQVLADTFVQPMKDELSLQTKYGYLTQEQAGARLQAQQDRVKDMVNATPGAQGTDGYGSGACPGVGLGGPGGMMGAGGMMGFGGQGGPGFGGRSMMGWQ
ncbi:MAG: hypothetical protein Q7R39_01345 [Dehalococcoidia bacterium]|nr:hypothetical protein [Dehalococcoidia bacterium]